MQFATATGINNNLKFSIMEQIIEKLKNVTSPWDFVSTFYGAYTSSDDVAENIDLDKIVEGEINGCAVEEYLRIANKIGIFISLKEGDQEEFEPKDYLDDTSIQRIKNSAQEELDLSNAYLYEKAIEGLLEEIKNTQKSLS